MLRTLISTLPEVCFKKRLIINPVKRFYIYSCDRVFFSSITRKTPYFNSEFGIGLNKYCKFLETLSQFDKYYISSSTKMSSLPFAIDYDKRGQAKCKKCKQKLAKGWYTKR